MPTAVGADPDGSGSVAGPGSADTSGSADTQGFAAAVGRMLGILPCCWLLVSCCDDDKVAGSYPLGGHALYCKGAAMGG